MGGAILVETQAPSRIFLMIKAGTINLKAMGTTQAGTKWSQRNQAFCSVTTASCLGKMQGFLYAFFFLSFTFTIVL